MASGWEARLIAQAANAPDCSGNPSFTTEDFLAIYPQFAEVPPAALEMFLNLALASLSQRRWGESWQLGVCLFVAHWCTLYLRSQVPEGATARQILAAGENRGLVTSKAVGGVSVSVDYSAVASDLNGWAAWKETTYGTQWATLAQMVGMGGAVLW